MDTLACLELALAVTRSGAGRGLARRVQQEGIAALVNEFESLPAEQANTIRQEAARLESRGVGALIRGSRGYPDILARVSDAPPVLFYSGQLNLLAKRAIGICGSRNVSDTGLQAATICGELASSLGIVSVSGYARGVDTTTHVASLRSGGDTIIVIPEGIDHFKVKRNLVQEVWDESRTLILSQFAPRQPWSAGGAMARNTVIIGLSMALVVVDAGEKGGTLAAGQKALNIGRRVLALEFNETPIGNRMLIDRGAVSVRNKLELATLLDELRSVVDEPSSSPREKDENLQELLDI